MSAANPDDSSRFEEVTDEPVASPTEPLAAGSSADLPTRDRPAQVKPPVQPEPAAPTSEEPEHDDEGEGGSDYEDAHEDSVWWTPEELSEIIARSTALKAEGNRLFGLGQWDNALATYREALAELPVRTKPRPADKGKQREVEPATGLEEITSDKADGVDKAEELLAGMRLEEKAAARPSGMPEDDEAELEEVIDLRSVLFANVAACYIKLERWKDAVQACDDALEDNSTYTKALQRRAMANEAIGSWSSLSAALEDYNTLASLPGLGPLAATVKQAQRRLPPLIQVQQDKEKDQVLGQLKDLGNTVLGKFGLSTDNFKFVQQPGGGYSMNFER